MNTRNPGVLAIAAVLIASAASTVYLGHRWQQLYDGYCFAERKYFSDEDYVRAAMGHVAFQMGLDGSRQAGDRFLAGNPGCCSVDRESHMTGGRLERLVGFHHVVVELVFEVRPERVASTGAHRYRQYVDVLACGQRGEMYGEFIEPEK